VDGRLPPDAAAAPLQLSRLHLLRYFWPSDRSVARSIGRSVGRSVVGRSIVTVLLVDAPSPAVIAEFCRAVSIRFAALSRANS